MKKQIVLGLLLLVIFSLNWFNFEFYPMRMRKRSGNECKQCKNKDKDDDHTTTESTKDKCPNSSAPHADPWHWLSTVAVKKLEENKCAPPFLNPSDRDPAMIRIFNKNKFENCSAHRQEYYFKVNSRGKGDFVQEIVMVKVLPKTMKCCFSTLRVQERWSNSSVREDKSEICTFIQQTRTKLPIDSHFVHIKCWENVTTINPACWRNGTTKRKKKDKDIVFNKSLSLPPHNSRMINCTMKFSHNELLVLFPQPSKRLLENNARLLQGSKSKRHSKLNVIIIGFDKISRMNFIRQMNHSFKYLKSVLKAIDLHGFNKIGDATLNNTLAFLTGYDFGAVMKNREWWNPDLAYFDNLPWIWKKYSKMGHITSVANDFNSVFDYRFKGFKTKPTDYYLNSLLNWIRGRNRFNPFRISENSTSSKLCFGRVLILDLLQDYANKASGALRDYPYFQFVWNSAISEYADYASMSDNGLLSTLQQFKLSGVLNRSLVILLSDHGWRYGAIMNLSQARIENKMPFAFLLLPKWFKQVHPEAYENLHENQYRLTTPYDIHSTLEDMLNPEETLKNDASSKLPLKRQRFGISLFRTIPKSRTCESAGIDEVWCACSIYKEIPSEGKEAQKLARFAVDTLNSWLKPYNHCMHYNLEAVSKAEVKVSSQNYSNVDLSDRNTFRLVFTVATCGKSRPGFEVVVFTKSGWLQRDFHVESNFMKMSTEVFRITSYGSSCMKVYALKKICTCK